MRVEAGVISQQQKGNPRRETVAPASRFRTRARCRYGVTRPAIPRAVVSCTGVDGERAIVVWSRSVAVAHAAPMAALLATWVAWDRDADERAHVAAELRAWPFPRGWDVAPAAARYWNRKNTEVEPMRSVGVIGDLAAALAEIPDRRSAAARAVRGAR